MTSLRTLRFLIPLLLLMVAAPALAQVQICNQYCVFPAITTQDAQNGGVDFGKATITIKNAANSSFLPDLNYIEDGDNGQDFEVISPFFGIVTVVRRDQVLKIKTSSHRVPVVFNFYDNTGDYLPIPAVLGSNKTVSWPGLALPCIVFYSISSPLTSAQVGMIVVVEPENDLNNILIGAADGVIGDLCAANSKADLGLLDMTDGTGSGATDITAGEGVVWYNSTDVSTVVRLSDGRDVPVPAHDKSAPTLFESNGTFTYTVDGYNGLGIVDVQGNVSVTSESFGAVKARFGN